MKQRDAEELADDIRARARVAREEVLPAIAIARAVLGQKNVRAVPLRSCLGALALIDDEWFIAYHPRRPDQNFTIAHELGHLAKRLASMPIDAEEELDANRIGAALLAPRAPLERAAQETDSDPRELSLRFGTTQTCAVLRLGCVWELDTSVIGPTVHVLQYGNVPWPEDQEEIRRWTRGRSPHGLARTRLTGTYDRGRVALVRR